MKTKWQALLDRFKGDDMFGRTQRRLTFVYSGVLMLFLALFILIFYGILYYMIWKDQEQETLLLADQELQAIVKHVETYRGIDARALEREGVLSEAEGQLFNYIVGPDGELVYGTEADRRMRTELLALVQGGGSGRAGMHQTSLRFSGEPANGEGRRPPRGYRRGKEQNQPLEFRLLVAERPILSEGRQLGTLYVGMNVSYHYELFLWLRLVLAGLGVLFFGVALYISCRMSKRAMIPIQASYTKQREFVADASHELRTPLSVMLSSIDALEMEQTAETDPFVRKLLTGMKEEVKRMSGLVGDLLTLARSDMPEYRLQREVFDLEPYARSTADSMQSLAAAKGIRLMASLPGPLPVYGDAERLKQLLYILLDNAVQYTGEGGEIRLILREEGSGEARKAVIEVQDTGLGIAVEEQQRIFDRFYRADKARNRRHGGHGLGLAIAKWIVDAHRGTLGVDSAPGRGSVFTVRLPAAQET
ncbi:MULTISPECIES: sensor histidine kinase [Paenibacillus]|uniref:sensor histidine kinase n=1 Tax=Paenibacillus TaxID=44249 RepID=UPI0022B922D5|nr:ATP-binding protein [Paenibacillus caseinilyticus]MCZ8523429.1 ATP-binding protein [Paenibacillus caseinilyticus]